MQSRTVFAGRARELDELVAALEEAAAGRGRLVLLEGEPGIGKSRLADELAMRAREQGHQVLWGRGWEDAGAPPFWPWVQALRAFVRSTPAEDVLRHAGPGAADIAQILPELRTPIPDLPAPRDVESDSARFRLFDSTASLLRSAASARPLMVVLDDLQSADTPSILLLRFVASQLGDMALLLLGTYRDVEVTPEHPLFAAVAEMQREPVTRVVRLEGLEPAAVAEFIRATAGVQPNDSIVGAVWRATNGNPLFVGEAVKLLQAEGRLTDLGDARSLRVAVPAGVRAVIKRRIGHLDGDTRRMLSLGAALGPEFGLDVLRTVAGLEPDVILDLVDHATDAGLLLPVVGTPGRYRFSHDLVRDGLYDELPPGRRARLHLQIAHVLEELHGGPAGGHLAELAFHYVTAAQHGANDSEDVGLEAVTTKAVHFARRAGDEATRALAFEEAARLYSMVLSVLDLAPATNDDIRIEVLLALGEAHARAADLDAARTAFFAAAEITRRTGKGRMLARAALGYGGRHQWARPGKDTRLIPLLQDALLKLGGADDRLRARLLTRLACAWRSSPERRGDSAALSSQATEIARQLDDTPTLCYTIVGEFWATWWPENPENRQRLANEMLDLAAALGDGERIAESHFMAMLSHAEVARMTEARQELDALIRTIDELREPAQFWLQPANRAWVALVEGDYDVAEELISEEGRATFRVTPARDDQSAMAMHRFLLRREQGRVAEEIEPLRHAVVEFPWYPFHRAALACALVDEGRGVEARSVFADLARDNFASLYRDNEWLFGMAMASEACARLGDAAAAEILHGQLLPFAGRHAIGFSEGSGGALDRYLGLLALTLGQLDDAVGHLEAAVEINDRMGARPWAAHSRHDLAEVLRRRDAPGDHARADILDGVAESTARSLGMVLADRIAGQRASPGPAATDTHATATFRREGEYWTIEFGDAAFRLHHTKGLTYLARLLAAQGTELHALALVHEEDPAPVPPTSRARRSGAAPDFRTTEGDPGPRLDGAAKTAYAERIQDIRTELAEAEEWNDPERASRLREEQAFLARELSGAFGLGGRDRATGSSAERARVSVTRAIRAALGRIAEQSATLGHHLEATIRTGTYCSYTPDPRAPIEWRT